MIIQIKENIIDFERPFIMEDETERKKFKKFLKETFPEQFSGSKDVIEKDKKAPKDPQERKPKHWTKEELLELYIGKDDSEIAKKLGRSEMSVRMKGADFCSSIDKLLAKDNIEYHSIINNPKLILEYIDKYIKISR
ncbi:MAG: hypothetical protein KC550_02520 [Nanoarchaeota archaeon]|nr:hypothetical protein [Nanoarchaeota archaeon]